VRFSLQGWQEIAGGKHRASTGIHQKCTLAGAWLLFTLRSRQVLPSGKTCGSAEHKVNNSNHL